MRVFALPDELLRTALEQPELAMGHQEVLVAFRSSQQERGYLVAGRYFVPATERQGMFRTAETHPPLQYIDTSPPEIVPLGPPSPLTRPTLTVVPHTTSLGVAIRKTAATGKTPPFVMKTVTGDVFYRLSPFPDDFRILPDDSVAPDAYATTLNDFPMVPSGLAAVGRYALPSRLPAVHCFEIRPPAGTNVAYGTVTPANGLAGGGVEAYFPNGCGKGSVKKRSTIPMK